jgi:hypothetical protein
MENDKVNEFLGDVPLKKIGKIRMPDGLVKQSPMSDKDFNALLSEFEKIRNRYTEKNNQDNATFRTK